MNKTNWRERIKNLFYKFYDLGFAYPEGLRVGVEQITRDEILKGKIGVLWELREESTGDACMDSVIYTQDLDEKIEELTQQLNK